MEKEVLEFRPEHAVWTLGLVVPSAFTSGLLLFGVADTIGFLTVAFIAIVVMGTALTVRHSNVLDPRRATLEVRRGFLFRQRRLSILVTTDWKIRVSAFLSREMARAYVTLINPNGEEFSVLTESTEKYSKAKRRAEAVGRELGIPVEIHDSYLSVRREYNNSLNRNRNAWVVITIMGAATITAGVWMAIASGPSLDDNRLALTLMVVGVMVGVSALLQWLPIHRKPLE